MNENVVGIEAIIVSDRDRDNNMEDKLTYLCHFRTFVPWDSVAIDLSEQEGLRWYQKSYQTTHRCP